METNENTRTNLQEEVILLGIASEETKGLTGTGEPVGIEIGAGISED